MEKRFFKIRSSLILGFCLFLSACGNQGQLISVTPPASTLTVTDSPSLTAPPPTPRLTLTFTPNPTSTFTSTAPRSKTPRPTSTPKPTRTPPVYLPPEKNILLDYTSMGSHGYFDDFGYLDFSRSNLVLYEDGQLIIPFQQKILSPEEVFQFFSQLDAMGYYTLESNQKHDLTDLLYDFGDQYSRTYDGLLYCVLTNGDRGRNLCAYDPFREFLVPAMKNILAFLDNYHPAGMTPYEPDRLLLAVYRGDNPFFTNPPQKTISWPETFPSIVTEKDSVLLIQGEFAKEIYALFDGTHYVRVSYKGVEYSIYFEIVLPHEIVRQP